MSEVIRVAPSIIISEDLRDGQKKEWMARQEQHSKEIMRREPYYKRYLQSGKKENERVPKL